jgi:hypothetical protein
MIEIIVNYQTFAHKKPTSNINDTGKLKVKGWENTYDANINPKKQEFYINITYSRLQSKKNSQKQRCHQ